MHTLELLNYQPIAELIYSLLLALGMNLELIHLIIDDGVSYTRSLMSRVLFHGVAGPMSHAFKGLMVFQCIPSLQAVLVIMLIFLVPGVPVSCTSAEKKKCLILHGSGNF